MARLLAERYAGHALTVYPDASGGNTSSKAADVSDLSILRAHGLRIVADAANPSIRERVNAANALLCNSLGKQR